MREKCLGSCCCSIEVIQRAKDFIDIEVENIELDRTFVKEKKPVRMKSAT